MKTESSKSPSFEMQPLRAFRALRLLLSNPDDTSQVFTIIEALSGKAPLAMLTRFRSDPRGHRLLATRPSMLTTLIKRDLLEQMPVGSLAHHYLAFIDREGITADGLVQASVDGEIGAYRRGNDFDYVSERMRDTHDLWHTVTGYQGDVLGEAALLAFSVAQTRNPGVALIVMGALIRAHDLDVTGIIARAYRDGEKSEWLPAAEWEELLPLPLDEVRRRLRVAAVRPYTPMRTSWLRETGELQAA